MSAIKQVTQTWPVVEIFGPTVQGEGVDQGVVCHFVRFGGCDYRCVWCDTPHAVLPAEVRKNSEKLNATEIVERLEKLNIRGIDCVAPWIILSGGNPALLDLTDLLPKLHEAGYLVATETQGSRWREWMWDLDRICVSPKPPSAFRGAKAPMPSMDKRNAQVHQFLENALYQREQGDREYEWIFMKIVIFDDEDLDYAELMRKQLSNCLLYLSTGNDAGRTVGQPNRTDNRKVAGVRRDLLDKTRWLTEEVFKRPTLCAADVVIQSQFHVGLWGNELGR